MGDRVERFRLLLIGRGNNPRETTEGGIWDRVTRTVIRRPLLALMVTAGRLTAAAAPYLTIHTGTFGVSTFPEASEAKLGFMVLEHEFDASLNDPAEIDGEVESAAVQHGISRLNALLDSDPVFGPSRVETNDSGNLAVITVVLARDATGSEATITAVRTLRDVYVLEAFAGVPAQVWSLGPPPKR